MNSDYLRKQIERQSDLLKKRWNGEEGDPDVWNLEYMITEIRPGSRAWNRGVIRSLRRAIKALEREGRESGGGLICAVCGKPVERVEPCGYERWHGQVTCDECCEECFRSEPFPCRDHDERMKEKGAGK